MRLYVWSNSGHCFKEKDYEYVRYQGERKYLWWPRRTAWSVQKCSIISSQVGVETGVLGTWRWAPEGYAQGSQGLPLSVMYFVYLGYL